jgi:hypothetical protein
MSRNSHQTAIKLLKQYLSDKYEWYDMSSHENLHKLQVDWIELCSNPNPEVIDILKNNPDKIYFYYHYEPNGRWWEKTKEICEIIFVPIPTHIGNKELKKVAHKSDILRMKILKQYGGIYLDIDTICIRNYQDLLYNKFVIANEITDSGRNMELCNAIMMCEPNCSFINDWWNHYEKFFNPDGWQEASTILPYEISKVNTKNSSQKNRE